MILMEAVEIRAAVFIRRSNRQECLLAFKHLVEWAWNRSPKIDPETAALS